MKPNHLPLVSVVMPVHNAEKYLLTALESIAMQTYHNWELIIVDDASTDKSLSIAQNFALHHLDRVRILTLPRLLNAGGDCATNEGVRTARGAYIAKMDADDIAHVDRLKIQVEYLQKHPSIFLVGSQADVIDAEGNVVGRKSVPRSSSAIYAEYMNFHPLIHPSVMFRNEQPGTPFYKIRYPLANDYYTFFSLMCEGKRYVNLTKALLQYRIYGKNASLRNIKLGVWYSFMIKIDMMSRYGYRPSIKTLIRTFVQLACGLILPQRLSYLLYLIAKGIVRFPRMSLVSRKVMRDLSVSLR